LAYRILAASFVALLTSDLAFSGAILNGSYAIGSLITAGWPLFSILGATAALHPSMAHVNQPHTEGQHRLTKARVIFLAGGMLSVSIVHTLIEHTYSGRALEVFVVTAVLFGLLSARLLEFQQERKLYEQKLAHQALHDPLTDLANSALFRDRVAHLLQRRESSARSFALYFLDLDDFKTINDELGHAAGDELLCGVGERLTKTMRSEDTVARMGGDEFAILAERGSGSDDWHERLARRILDTTKLPYEVAGKLILMRASLGVVLHDGATQGTQINDLLRDADMAMYTAKAHGKGRFELFDEAMQIGARDRIAVESEMILGIERGEFVAFYQPIVSMSDGVVRASEALVRWNHPTRGLLAPGEFMDIAEETGLIVPLGRQVLAEACNHLAECKTHAASPLGLRMHVNVSVAQLHDVGLKAHLKRLLAENAIDPCDLVLEITETTLIHDIEGMAEVLKDLKEIGIRIAIDDFGTGYSSLSRLRHFPIDILKIDKAFVDGITHGPEDAAVVGALITLARGLNMEIVAEGVERADQLKELHRMGCAFAQGYLLGRPSPAEHFVDGSSSLEPERFIRV
ncbi:MAG: hypothetical protein QOC87_2085, partial [Actinomycetota bacterium]|nr:hypothetical protein [Actinomycetota bacterium]